MWICFCHVTVPYFAGGRDAEGAVSVQRGREDQAWNDVRRLDIRCKDSRVLYCSFITYSKGFRMMYEKSRKFLPFRFSRCLVDYFPSRSCFEWLLDSCVGRFNFFSCVRHSLQMILAKITVSFSAFLICEHGQVWRAHARQRSVRRPF